MKTKTTQILSLLGFLLLFSATAALATDYEWMSGMNARATADPYGYRAGLSARFHTGDATIDTVLQVVDTAADAYMLFRLGELSNQPIDDVLRRYNAEKGKGWGVLAKSLGIKPGSREFHALKNGSDANSFQWGVASRDDKGHGNNDDKEQGKGQGQGMDHGKSKGKGKNK